MRLLNLAIYERENADIILESAEKGDMRTLKVFVEKDRTFMTSYANALARAAGGDRKDANYLPTLQRLLQQPDVIDPARLQSDREGVALAFSYLAAYRPDIPLKVMRLLTRTFNGDDRTKQRALKDIFEATSPRKEKPMRIRAARLLGLPYPK